MKTDWIAGLLGPWSAELAPGSILLRLALSMALAPSSAANVRASGTRPVFARSFS